MAKRGGGCKRKRDRCASAKHTRSLLVRHLLYLYTWGFISLPFAQRLAELAARDIETAIVAGSGFEDLDMLSGLGGICMKRMQ